jgi:uncharacterized protein YndB with AHSA1/START domain
MILKNNMLQVTKFIPAEPEIVFAAWTDPKLVEKWFCPIGMKVQVHEWETVAGGNLQLSIIDGEDVYNNDGVFQEVTPFHRIAFTYGWAEEEEDAVETLVTVEFKNLDDGTDVTVTQEGVDPEDIEGNKEGWMSALSNLATMKF